MTAPTDHSQRPTRSLTARPLLEEMPELEAGHELKLGVEPGPQDLEPQLLVAEVQEETEPQMPPPREVLLLQRAPGGLLGNARGGDSRVGRFDFTVAIVRCFALLIDCKFVPGFDPLIQIM